MLNGREDENIWQNQRLQLCPHKCSDMVVKETGTPEILKRLMPKAEDSRV